MRKRYTLFIEIKLVQGLHLIFNVMWKVDQLQILHICISSVTFCLVPREIWMRIHSMWCCNLDEFYRREFFEWKMSPVSSWNFAPLSWIILSSPFREVALLTNHERINGYLTYIYFRRGRSREVHGWSSRDYDAGVYTRWNYIGYHPADRVSNYQIIVPF